VRPDFSHPVFGLPTLDELDGPALCPNCGPITSLTSGWLREGQEPEVLFCSTCGAAVVVL
jgi:hypothetical protein